MSEVMEKPETKPAKKGLRMFKITFHGEGGNVEVGHNFKLNSYPRNVECLIDENYLGVVKDAVVTTEVRDEKGEVRKVSIPQYQYTVEPV